MFGQNGNGFAPLEETKQWRRRQVVDRIRDGSLRREEEKKTSDFEAKKNNPLPPPGLLPTRWIMTNHDGTKTELTPVHPPMHGIKALLYIDVLREFKRREGQEIVKSGEDYAKEIYDGLGKDLQNLERVDLKTSYNHYDIYYDVTHIPGLKKACEDDLSLLSLISVAFLHLIEPFFPASVRVHLEFFQKLGGRVVSLNLSPPFLTRSRAVEPPHSLYQFVPPMDHQDGIRLNISWADKPLGSPTILREQEREHEHAWGRNETGIGPLLPMKESNGCF